MPLDNIEDWYRQIKFSNRNKVEVKHDTEILKKAQIKVWNEKNGGLSKTTKDTLAEKIMSGCST